jgi:hypothetical protein
MNELSFVNKRFSRFLLDSLLRQVLNNAREEELKEFEEELEFEGAKA